MALVVVLSAFNGLESLVNDLYSSFDPDIKITASKGKSFDVTNFPKDKILANDNVIEYVESLEEVALIKYRDKQTIATVKGVTENFINATKLDSFIIDGNANLMIEEIPRAIVGYGVSDKLSLFINDVSASLMVIVPKKGNKKSIIPGNEFIKKQITPGGIFSITPDFDVKYMLVPIEFSRKLLNKPNQVSSIELKIKNAPIECKKWLVDLLGDNYEVKTRYELNEIIYKTNATEKWITFLILSFILLIAAFNIVSSITMLIIDKKKDIWILKTLGATIKQVKSIFFIEGIIINLFGAFTGMFLGIALTLLQIHVGLLKLSGGVVEYYPMKIQWMDFVYILFIVLFIGSLASYIPASIVSKSK
jgi:ABC-type lipoprotein release transport system permease subunit